MCGIIGYVGEKHNAINVLLDGLSSLEYRGYDSAGLAFKNKNKIKIIKSEGKIVNLKEKVKDYNSNAGIGHTRWATHGVPSEINAHPHYANGVSLVHNGIIENYEILKNKLKKEGYEFKSQTDTEVACAYISYLYKKYNNKLKCLVESSKILKGSYAFGIIFDDELDTIYAMRKDSPLIVALGKEENFIASDVPAILSYTNKYVLLEEHEIAVIKKNKIDFYNNRLKKITKEILTYEGTKESIMKNGYKHFMLKEINDEPSVINEIINSYFKDFNIKTLNKNFGNYRKYNKISIIACGSAYHAGLVGKSIIEETTNIKTDVYLASEYRYNKIFSDKKTLVILISQSGETADTLAALRKAKSLNMDTLGIINVVASSIARESNNVIYLKAGPEIAVATTKAYTAQVFILILLSIVIANQKGLIKEENANKILKSFKSLPNEIKNIIDNCDYKLIAKKVYEKNDIFFIGRKVDYSLCMEGSLKLKEISYIHSEAYAAGELKHGTISLIEKDTPVFTIITDNVIDDKTVSNAKETKARGALIILITTDHIYKKYENDKFCDYKIVVPYKNIYVTPILTILPLQLIAYEVALLKGESIDQPRNLAKSVTVE